MHIRKIKIFDTLTPGYQSVLWFPPDDTCMGINEINLFISLTVYIVCFYGFVQVGLGIRLETETRTVLLKSFFFLLLYNSFNLASQIMDGESGELIHVGLVLTNFGEFMSVPLLIYAITKLMKLQIGEDSGPDIVTRIILLCITGQVVLLVINLFTGIIYTISLDPYNVYTRMGFYALAYVLPTVAFLTLFGLRVAKGRRLKRKEILVFDFCFTFTITAEVIQAGIKGINLTILAACTATTMLYLLVVGDQRERYDEQLRKNAAMSARMMSGQIEPHFISNTLVMIRSLCEPDSEAFDAITNLSEFMRGSLRVLSETGPIPVEDEIDIIERYLEIQNQRFEDSINVKWDIDDVDFSVPAFSVQIAVENAIKHGIRKTPDGHGTISISTEETDDAHIVRVRDDGAGFDTSDRKDGTGLGILRERVRSMCRGSVEIQSEPGRGTEVMISITRGTRSEDTDNGR